MVWLRTAAGVALALAFVVPAFARLGARVRVMQTSPDAPVEDIAVKGRPVLISNVAFRQVADYLPVDAGTYDLRMRAAGTDTVALEVTGLALQNRAVYTILAMGIVGGEPPLTAIPSPDAQHSVLPWTGGLAIASPCLPLALAIGAMLVFGGLVLRRQFVRIK